MALEDRIDALNETIQQLISALAGKKAGTKAAAPPEDDGDDAEEEQTTQRKRKRKGKAAKKEVTVDNVRDALVKLSEEKGKQDVIDILSRFGVKKIGDLPEENYAEAVDMAEKAMAGEDADDEEDDGELFE